jgi:hypothetical protein
VLSIHERLFENPVNGFLVILPISVPSCIPYFLGIDIGNQFVVESAMTILQRTGRYIFFVSVFMLVLQVAVVTGRNRKGGVTVSYESLGSSRVARFTNSNSFPVRVDFSYNGTRVHGSGEASGEDAVL